MQAMREGPEDSDRPAPHVREQTEPPDAEHLRSMTESEPESSMLGRRGDPSYEQSANEPQGSR